jgi:signal transduction histidine kinase
MSAQSTTMLAPLRPRDRQGGLSPVGVSLQDARVEGSAARPGSDGGEFFAACVAHELRTSLTTQRALLELALADRNASVASWREIGEDVLAACRQLEQLLEACLTLGVVRLRTSLDPAYEAWARTHPGRS